ncbi:hypothetical protein [uncultured Rhodoblastus sp.]|uniref:hypothetical protein n=1 Tax=uncultured Rhodoblastus sp. TaxID=543037 RepID=UPI0025F12C8B|nr:hypothetical protein [uncultured Rhodoblastus sp.]
MSMDDLVLARALHVLAIVHWIGGVGFVTLVVLPYALSRASAAEGLAFFDAVERRFASQVRLSIPIAGAAGLWLTYKMDVWERFRDLHFWWMGAMLGLWLVFMILVFVVEPLIKDSFDELAARDPSAALHRLSRLHRILLAIAALTILGAVAGAQGLVF